MSRLSIQQYQREIEKVEKAGGKAGESQRRRAFANLLDAYAKPKDYTLIDEVTLPSGKRPDGAVKTLFGFNIGFWEAKDDNDKLDEQIVEKIKKGYPTSNILFENGLEAVLIQDDIEVLRARFEDETALDALLKRFTNKLPPEVRSFEEALITFKEQIPTIVETLRGVIEAQAKTNKKFVGARQDFWELCRRSINPDITLDDIREMIIQHILTEDIFNRIFDETQFHRENNIARELAQVIDTFFTRDTRRLALDSIKHYYDVINARSAQISDHHEKQKFLKLIYENFYKAYNPKGADRLGIVYTPQEIVRFMIESTDYLLDKHFNKTLGEPDVEILDPATGTGTFICDLIDYLPKKQLPHKYAHEIHANEVAILPYYIANLNIEYTYRQKMGVYAEFPNLVFVDTLDNLGFGYAGKQGTLAIGLAAENQERIKRQNEKKISVIIGNPPYNALQKNYNDDNANRAYKGIDERIKESYIKYGKAQNKNQVYDMYARFLRWATDRVDENGIVAFVTNNSFVNARTYDGFRKCVAEEFNYIYIVNTRGDARTSGERRRQEKGNIFDDKIRVGVAIYFLIKKKDAKGCEIYYNEVGDYLTAQQKLDYISGNQRFKNLEFDRIRPDNNHNWINQTDNDWDTLLPVCTADAKAVKGKATGVIFQLFSNGLKSQRDEWVYDFSKEALVSKMQFFVREYERDRKAQNTDNKLIKYDAELARYIERDVVKKFEENTIVKGVYRPFVKQWLYFDSHFNGRTYKWPSIYQSHETNTCIAFSGLGSSKPFHLVASDTIIDLHATGDSQCLPLYRYEADGTRHDNITDWALAQFAARYAQPAPPLPRGGGPKGRRGLPSSPITKEAIFHYVYAVLHHPAYRTQYELNLKRELPRIPLYDDFWQWSAWGKALMELHIGYEAVKPYKLKRIDKTDTEPGKAKLKADKDAGTITLDEQTSLLGVPAQAWAYKLGNRSALEWVLDQYKEHTPKDPTIREKFNTYKFADYKEHVIDLLSRVCTVSVETMGIIGQMPK